MLAGVRADARPASHLRFTWGDDELRIELSPHGDQTALVLIHTFDYKPGAASFAAGWDQCLAALGSHLAGEAAPEPGNGVERHEELVARFGLDQPMAGGPCG